MDASTDGKYRRREERRRWVRARDAGRIVSFLTSARYDGWSKDKKRVRPTRITKEMRRNAYRAPVNVIFR